MTGLRPGAAVMVRDDWPETRGPAHIRTPHYLRGRRGTVLRRLGEFPNPEQLAFGQPAPRRALYHVSFPLASLWPERQRGDRSGDDLVAEIFEHWLEAA